MHLMKKYYILISILLYLQHQIGYSNCIKTEPQLIVRNLQSTYIFLEILNTVPIQYYTWRVSDCSTTRESTCSSPKLYENKLNISSLTADSTYHLLIDLYINNTELIQKNLSFKTPPLDENLAIENLHATYVSHDKIQLAWKHFNGRLWYTVHLIVEGSEVYTIKTYLPSAEFAQLNSGTKYKVYVHTFTRGGFSATSDVIYVTTLSEETDVWNLVVVNAYADAFDLHWDSSGNDVTYTISGPDLTKKYRTKRNYVTVVTNSSNKIFTYINIGNRKINLYFDEHNIRRKIFNVRASQASSKSLLITWDPIPDAIFYYIRVEKSLEKSPSKFEYTNIEDNKILVNYLQPNCTYKVVVGTQIMFSTIESDVISMSTAPADESRLVNIEVVSIQGNTVSLRWSNVLFTRDVPRYELTVTSNQKLALIISKNQVTIPDLIGGKHVFTVTLKEVNGQTLNKIVNGEIQVNIPEKHNEKKPYVKSFVIKETASTWLHVQWNSFEGANKYVLKYSGKDEQFAYFIPAKNSILVYTKNVTKLTLGKKYSLSVQAYVYDNIISSRTISAITGSPSRTSNLQAVDTFADSIDLYWTGIIPDDVRHNDIIYEIVKDDGISKVKYDSGNLNQMTLWNIDDANTLNITMIAKINGSDEILARSSIDITLPSEEKPKVEDFEIFEISSRALTCRWGKMKDFNKYRVFYSRKGQPQITYDVQATENYLKVLNLTRNTTYIFWVQTSVGELVQYRSDAQIVSTLAQDLDSIESLHVIRTYSGSFDLEWSHYPHAIYGIKTIPDVTRDKEYINNATTIFTSLDNRDYIVSVYVKKLHDVELLDTKIESKNVQIKLPKKGSISRPKINLWVAKQSLKEIKLSWDVIDRQATFSIDQECCSPNKSKSITNYDIGGLNHYTAKTLSPESSHPFTKGFSCRFTVSIRTIERRAYHFDWKSNEVRVDFIPDVYINKTQAASKGRRNTEISILVLLNSALIVAMAMF